MPDPEEESMEQEHAPEQEQAARATWLVGLRRFDVQTEALEAYVASHGITGAVWTPSAAVVDDYAGVLHKIVEAGARPDDSLLYDMLVTDVRQAGEELRFIWRDTRHADGWVVIWLPPDRLGDVQRAVSYAATVYYDCDRPNVAMAFAWNPSRAGVLSALIADGYAVAVSGVRDAGDAEQVATARDKGMQRRRAEAEDPDAVEEHRVFLLGADLDHGQWVRGVHLTGALQLLGSTVAPVPTVPTTPDEERDAFQRLPDQLAALAGRPERGDAVDPETFARDVQAECQVLDRRRVAVDLWSRDHTLWAEDPAEISDRLGWLDVGWRMRGELDDLASFGRGFTSGLSRVVLMGMGGSSLAPEVFAAMLPGSVPITVVDSTHPEHVAAVTASLDPDSTGFVVSSKSGTTLETMCHLEHFWQLSGQRGDRFVAITDPGSALSELAAQRGFARVFENPPDIGGRFSAMSYFGLVPAAICGIDVRRLLGRCLEMAGACGPSAPAERSPGLHLGAILSEAYGLGRDKLTLVMPEAFAPLGAWLEQLIAESTGKEDKGVLPVVDEPLAGPEVYADDRIFVAYAVGDEPFDPSLEALEADHPVVRIRVGDVFDVGAEMYRWQIAVAILGYTMQINPFDQPDVESAKRRTRDVLDGGPDTEVDAGSAPELLDGLEAPAYLAIQAFLPPTHENLSRLAAARLRLRDGYMVATTLGFGPRFLHSTGQLHKGGLEPGAFLQITGAPGTDVEIPGKAFTFGRLIAAQADGDLLALQEAGRDVARLSLDELEAVVAQVSQRNGDE